MVGKSWYDKMEYEKLTYFGYPINDLFDFERKNGMVPLNFLLLKNSVYNIMSSSRWLEKFVRISGNMKKIHIL